MSLNTLNGSAQSKLFIVMWFLASSGTIFFFKFPQKKLGRVIKKAYFCTPQNMNNVIGVKVLRMVIYIQTNGLLLSSEIN
jgi:hypothetical protein